MRNICSSCRHLGKVSGLCRSIDASALHHRANKISAKTCNIMIMMDKNMDVDLAKVVQTSWIFIVCLTAYPCHELLNPLKWILFQGQWSGLTHLQ